MDRFPVFSRGAVVFKKDPVIVLLGPTGSGKSSIALDLAGMFPTELVCMDSMQVYSELKIGNTAPKQSERALVPHHLFGHVSIREDYSSFRWLRECRNTISRIQKKGKIPLLIGGTGLYYKLFMEGISAVPQTPPSIRQRLNRRIEEKGLLSLYRLLQKLDPNVAATLHPNDRQRIQRFLEVRLLTGKSIRDFWNTGRSGASSAHVLTLGVRRPRALLRRRITERLNRMVLEGWLDEVSFLNKKGLRQFVEERGPIGYGIFFRYLDGKIATHSDAIELVDAATRKYAKRQMTWFQTFSNIEWIEIQDEMRYNQRDVYKCIVEFLENGSHKS
ncbi:MAG: tRNA (adenosine(37)-N6)-dimethylallyltransferase MiaA [Acidobacteria bacterium]|nr:MAG: tRNA (adenosine(37)-N6)-dimethylallyltransferase MiaA [Acidobacteriota bacterium]